ncbi:MAG TPA: cytochrome C, partial [Bacteroidota bacterium]|nr:cytochrome C [Bacteroidota bacterium]
HLNDLHGDYRDPDAKIIPVKIHRARQPYDSVYRWIVQPRLYAERKGEGGYWQDFDWQTAARAGMAMVGKPFSGKMGFIETRMVLPVNHMVSPKSQTVQCIECHTRRNSRLAGLTDFYLPGRDNSAAVDGIGTGAILAALTGVVVHGALRIGIGRKKNRKARP